MKQQDAIIAYPETEEQFNALVTFMKELNIGFEINNEPIPSKTEQTPVWHKKIIENRLNNLKKEDLIPWEDVKEELNKKEFQKDN